MGELKGPKLSEMGTGHLDVRMSSDKAQYAPGGGHTGSIDAWQLAMQYAILQEIKDLNKQLRAVNLPRQARTVERMDRRLAKKVKLK